MRHATRLPDDRDRDITFGVSLLADGAAHVQRSNDFIQNGP